MAKILIQNGQNSCFLKRLWPQIPNVLAVVTYITIGDLKCLEGSIFLPKKSVFAKEASLTLK